jgi:hypothetical protein
MRVQRRGARENLFTDVALHGLLGRALDGVRLHVCLEIAALTEAFAADGAGEWSVGEGDSQKFTQTSSHFDSSPLHRVRPQVNLQAERL